MKKQEYIEKYGEEAYQNFLKRQREYNHKNKEKRALYSKQYWIDHKEDLSLKYKEYYQDNKEHYTELAKKRYEENRDSILSYNKDYRTKNKEVRSAKFKEWYKGHKDQVKSYNKKYREDNKGELSRKEKIRRSALKEDKLWRAKERINSHKWEDIKMGRGNIDLKPDWYVEHIFNSKCIYCGETDWHKLGCDRIDNDKAHTTDNVVCACISCNVKRGSIPFREYLLSVNPSEASDILSSLGLD